MSALASGPQTISIHVPFQITKRGGRKEMVLPAGSHPQRPRTDNTVVKALGRAFRWKRMLEAGSYSSVTELAEKAHPGIPLVAQGHSFGAIVTLFRLLAQPRRYRAGVISGAPMVPVAALLDSDTSFDLDPAWLSSDPFYVDSLENDPLAFVEADGTALTRALDRPWDRFGNELPALSVPTLAVHGEDDPIAAIVAFIAATSAARADRWRRPASSWPSDSWGWARRRTPGNWCSPGWSSAWAWRRASMTWPSPDWSAGSARTRGGD